jgi:hypothetical protein
VEKKKEKKMKILLENTEATKNKLARAMAQKQLQLSVEFNNETIIGITEVKRLMAIYRQLLSMNQKQRGLLKGQLYFKLFNRIKDFDLTFIASLNLIKFSFKNISIRIIFNSVPPGSEEEECLFRFGHFLTTSYISYGHEIFSILRDGKTYQPNYFLKNLSGYLPFYYVQGNIFQKLFHEPLKKTWDDWWQKISTKSFKSLIDKKSEAEKIYQQLRQHVIQDIDLNELKENREENILNSCILYMFSAVRKFHFIKKILKNQAQANRFKDAGISIDAEDSKLGIGLTIATDHLYEEEVQNIFEKILEKPPAFIILFSYFIEEFYSPKPKKNASYTEKIEVRVKLISDIFYFTNEIFYGIRELAKNIIEHSTNRRGVIIGRIVKKNHLPGLKPNMHVESYLKGRNEKKFIDLIVIDDGGKGIIERTIENLEVLKNEFKETPGFQEKFEKDIENLSNDKIMLHDFFNPKAIKLNYQEIRSALSLGLLIFSHLILENNGYMIVSSPQKEEAKGLVLFKNWESKRELKEIVPLGTFYNILFPKNLKQPPTPRSEAVPFEMPSGESAFNKLFKVIRNCEDVLDNRISRVKDLEHDDRLCFIDYRLKPDSSKNDIEEIATILKKCEDCAYNKTRKILSIDLKKVFKFDPSDLFRFLAKIQMIKDIKSIIVHNVKDETVFRIIEFFEIFRKLNFKIGSNDHFVLFYYLTKDQQADYYYSFLLAGESWNDLWWINDKIAKSNYSQEILHHRKNTSENTPYEPSPQFQKDYRRNPIFTSEGHLLPFDILIKKNKLTLFERNVLSDLNKPAGEKSSRSYKFVDAHMRLGSKIHLKDFFYARRIFQNSFYSLRFAYLVSKYIGKNLHDWVADDNPKHRQLTILGYGLYSELLISNVTRFLRKIYRNWEIEHALIDEVETPKVSGTISKNIILIVPISSTLSTSHKIAVRLKKKFPESRIIGHPINVMIVGNGNLKNVIDINGTVTNETVGNFWKHLDIDNKIITTKSLRNREKFFLYLPSEWYLPQECKLCFPDKPAEESVLFETDKISVTPSLIFELPPPKESTQLSVNIIFGEQISKTQKNQLSAVLTENMLIYGHTTREPNHYLYYVETTDFLKRNKGFLKEWLESVKEKLKEKPEIFDSKVILIAPAHFTNADFINLVNETIFFDVATLFHYDQNEDYIQNLKSFFGDDITQDSYVFFIDDAVSRGRTFEKINDFIKYARSGDYSRGIDGAFVLINRLTQDKHSILTEEAKRAGFFAFIDLDVPIMIDSERFCHICSEKDRHEKILEETMLDSLRILLKAKITKLEENKYKTRNKFDSERFKSIKWKFISKESCMFANPENQNNYLKRLEFVHKLYGAFSNTTVKGKVEQIFENCKSLESLCKEIQIKHSQAFLTEDEKVNIIKVLSYPYFVYHKEIRKYIFKIVIKELEKTIKTLTSIPDDQNLEKADVNTFRYLKFLIKRAALLKSNYLIRKRILTNIIELLEMIREKLKHKKKDKRPLYSLSPDEKQKLLKSLDRFIDYYILTVKEVVWYNESKSLKLEETLNNLLPKNGHPSGGFSLFINSLRIENVSIPFQFMNALEKYIRDIDFSFTEKNYHQDIHNLTKVLIQYCLDNPYRSAPLLAFLGFEEDKERMEENEEREEFLHENHTFNTKLLPMILLKAFFLNEKTIRKEKTQIKLKMNYILFCLCKILEIEAKSGGAFFVLKYMEAEEKLLSSNLFTIGHIGKIKEIHSFDWNNSHTTRMFNGYMTSLKDLPLTHVQIVKKKRSFLTHFGEKVDRKRFSEATQLSDMMSFLFLRIADDELDSNARGVFVFYNSDPVTIPPENIRYIMILKNEIFSFLEKNYENYSFKLWLENEKIDEFYGYLFHRVRRNIINPLQQRKILMKNGTEDLSIKENLEKIDDKLKSYVKFLSKFKEYKICSIKFSSVFDSVVKDYQKIYKATNKKTIYTNDIGSRELLIKIPDPLESQLDEQMVFENLSNVFLGNLLENAFSDNAGKATQVEINAFLKDNLLQITIKDNGVGIKNIPGVLSNSVSSQFGLGLGLKIIRDTIEVLLDGNFSLSSLEDGIEGVLARIKIPIQKEES